MLQDQTQIDDQNVDSEEEAEQPLPRFYISAEAAKAINRSLPLMLVSRMGYTSRQAFDESPSPDDDVKPYIERIAEVDSKDADYLLPDTPLKEAIFRIILANKNQPMSGEDISEILTERWAMTAYPRDITPEVIQRLLESSGAYCIVQVDEAG